jgi:hypothetical protein
MLGSLPGDHHGAKKYLDGHWQDELETLSLSLGKKDGTYCGHAGLTMY